MKIQFPNSLKEKFATEMAVELAFSKLGDKELDCWRTGLFTPEATRGALMEKMEFVSTHQRSLKVIKLIPYVDFKLVGEILRCSKMLKLKSIPFRYRVDYFFENMISDEIDIEISEMLSDILNQAQVNDIFPFRN